MTCWNCGKRISKNIPFCPHCGKMQDVANEKSYTNKDPFAVLQISKDAEEEVIKAAYRSLAKKYHPDSNSSAEAEEKMKEITWAYELLSNEVKRHQWKHRENESAENNCKKPPPTRKDTSSTISCPDCGTRYFKHQATCPTCEEEKSTNEKIRQTRITWFGFGIIAILVFFVFANWPNSTNGYSSSSTSTTKVSTSTPVSIAVSKPTLAINTPTSLPLLNPLWDCIRWDEVNDSHVGQESCVYGKILETRYNITPDNYKEYVIRFSIPDKFLFKSIGYYFPEAAPGVCFVLIGVIEKNPNYFYMQSNSREDVLYRTLSSCD